MKLFRNKLNKELGQAYKNGREIIFREMEKRTSEAKELMKEVGRKERALERLLARKGAAEDAVEYHTELAQTAAEHLRAGHMAKSNRARRMFDRISDEIKPIEDTLGSLRKQYSVLNEEEQILRNLYSGAQTDPQGVLSLVKAKPEVQLRFPSIGRWADEISEVANTRETIYKAVSRNINNEPKFVKEYLKNIHGRTDNYANAWRANPENAAMLAELYRSKNFGKYLDIGEGTQAARESLKGLSRSELARKLGITTAVAATVAGPVAFMSWFDDESDDIKNQTSKTATNINTFKATGLGATILDETRKALKTINDITVSTESSLGNDPKTAATKYVKTLIQQKAIIDKNLGRWNVVVESSDDRDAAVAAGKALRDYSATLEKQLNDAGEVTGVTQRPGRTVEPGIAGNIRVSKDRVKAVQNWLSSRFPTVAPTGNLDQPTIRALKMLEREYDRLGATNRFSAGRLLVRPDQGHLIEVNDLDKLDKRMQQYRK